MTDLALVGGHGVAVGFGIKGVFTRDHAEKFGVILASVLVLRADVDELLELPAVAHGGHQIGELVLVTLKHPIHNVSTLSAAILVALLDPLLDQSDQTRDIVELGFLQNAYNKNRNEIFGRSTR